MLESLLINVTLVNFRNSFYICIELLNSSYFILEIKFFSDIC